MIAKNACSPNQMGVRWPPLFWADLSPPRVTRHHTFLWCQSALYHRGQSKMWKRNMKGKLHKWHMCSYFISSFLWAENVIPWLQLAGIISCYIPAVVGVFTPFESNNRVDTSRKLIAYLVQINWTHKSNIRNIFPLLSDVSMAYRSLETQEIFTQDTVYSPLYSERACLGFTWNYN